MGDVDSDHTVRSDEELFDGFCRDKKYGELATSDNTTPADLKVYEVFRRFFKVQCDWFEKNLRQKYGKTARVHPNFCSNPELNAFATRHKSGLYLIGIYTGALAELGHAYEQLFTHAPSLGKGILLGEAQRQFGREQILCEVAFCAACNFMFAHELGHIAYGHTDLSRLLLEANSISKKASKLKQSMEVDADLHASTSLLAQIAKNQLCGVKITQFLQSRADLLRISMIAVLVMFHLFYGDRIRISEYRSASHPLPEVRFLKFFTRVHQMQKEIPELRLGDGSVEHLVAEILDRIPTGLKSVIFPALALEGRVNMLKEAKRVRKNEDHFERKLKKHAMIRVGEVIC